MAKCETCARVGRCVGAIASDCVIVNNCPDYVEIDPMDTLRWLLRAWRIEDDLVLGARGRKADPSELPNRAIIEQEIIALAVEIDNEQKGTEHA